MEVWQKEKCGGNTRQLFQGLLNFQNSYHMESIFGARAWKNSKVPIEAFEFFQNPSCACIRVLSKHAHMVYGFSTNQNMHRVLFTLRKSVTQSTNQTPKLRHATIAKHHTCKPR